MHHVRTLVAFFCCFALLLISSPVHAQAADETAEVPVDGEISEAELRLVEESSRLRDAQRRSAELIVETRRELEAARETLEQVQERLDRSSDVESTEQPQTTSTSELSPREAPRPAPPRRGSSWLLPETYETPDGEDLEDRRSTPNQSSTSLNVGLNASFAYGLPLLVGVKAGPQLPIGSPRLGLEATLGYGRRVHTNNDSGDYVYQPVEFIWLRLGIGPEWHLGSDSLSGIVGGWLCLDQYFLLTSYHDGAASDFEHYLAIYGGLRLGMQIKAVEKIWFHVAMNFGYGGGLPDTETEHLQSVFLSLDTGLRFEL